MELKRTRKGWEESSPAQCPNGHELACGRVLVGSQQCNCGTIHRTHTCQACHATVYTPALGSHCRHRNLDER